MVATTVPLKASSTLRSKASITAQSRASSVAGTTETASLDSAKSYDHKSNPIQHGGMGQAERAFSAASTLLSGIMAISASQLIGAPLKLVDPKFYNAYMSWTKESFAVLMTAVTQWWSPTLVTVSGDGSMKDQLYQMDDGTLKCNFPHRLVLMANHQLYTDWLYLWWIAYTNKMHGHIYIILKESLKQLPIFGWGAQFYNFIFLSRKWDTDKYRFRSALSNLKNPKDPMWLLIFPEGTNLSSTTREKSAAWAKKSGVPDMKHGLLPRSTGLQFSLQELRHTTNWLYDCTIAYEGVPEGLYGQDIFTLRSCFLEGRPPKSVNMFWRRFKISEMPLDNDEAFRRWLNNRWREKDYILEYFFKFNGFPAEEPTKAITAVGGKRKPKHANTISTEVKGGGWDEFLGIFGPLTSTAGALSSIDLTEPMNFDVLLGHATKQQPLNLLHLDKSFSNASQEVVRNALKAAQQSKSLPQPILEYLLKYTPKTQEQMEHAITKSANRSENSAIERKAGQTLVAEGAVSKHSSKDAAEVGKERKRLVSKVTTANSQNITKRDRNMANTMPMVNKKTAEARSLPTMNVQSPNSALTEAAQRAEKNAVAVSGQRVQVIARKQQSTTSVRASNVASASFDTKSCTSVNVNNNSRKENQVSPATMKSMKKKMTEAG